jgi:hypothetical protein
MIDFIESSDDVLAIKVSHKITGSDLASIMDRLDDLLEHNRKTHVFVESQAIDGIELSGLPSYVGRAMPLFTKLERFGRVAVVADQAWIRLGTEIESALLPSISYRTFTPDRREEALAWVQGRN